MMFGEEWKNYKNILCIRTDNIGDVLMTSPAIRALKEDVSGRKITLLTSSSGKSVVKLLPFIDDCLVYDFPWMNKNSPAEIINDAVSELEKRNFDAAILFTVYSQNPLPAAMLCRQAGIEKVAAYCRENPYGLLSDWFPDSEPIFEIKHEVERQLDLVRYLGIEPGDDKLAVHIGEQAEQRAKKIMESEGWMSGKKYLVIHPGVSEKRRQFPVEILAEAAEMIEVNTDLQFVLTGVEKEKELTGTLIEKLERKVVDLTGKLDIEELAAVLKNAELLVSNNTGPVHLAAATETPVLVLYALTNPQHLPWKTDYLALPFDVPPENRSKNVIIEYVYQKVFKEKPLKIKAIDICNCCLKLLERTRKEKTDMLSV